MFDGCVVCAVVFVSGVCILLFVRVCLFLSDFVYVMRFVCLIMCFGFVVVDVCVLPICVSGRVCFCVN